ncbi:phosphatase [Bacillus sp. ISL-47]|uniref:phosphatase n=1 Tax=Bacillus sp. ISL-47 TaxID=2819130 RepID=UPI001BE6CE25|nr:phosphatase [Bacillus sp. ISL-47]MBT2687075.1 phosphatase [Bacillus sp. ISL-47]MBT2707375.1 hypothetical protein [Pseudomonas sp. ISL-84]
MWRKNDGFLMAELLLSLSAWVIVAGVFFPLIIKAVEHSVEMKQDFESTQLLYEKLQQSVVEGYSPSSESIKRGQIVYEIFLKEGSELTEVCVKYEDIFKKANEKCEVYK